VLKAADAANCPEFLQISVTDSGCGIPPEEQDRIFDRLYQVKAGDAATEQGIGLGLYLCRELVQLHGGSIWVESEPGKGSSFSFTLPRDRTLLHANVLLIDGDAALLESMRGILAAERYNVRIARDGVEGLEQIRRQTPDIALLDLALPGLSGPALLGEIRRHWGALPVIVHTGHTEGDLMKQAIASCPFTLLAKPCSPQQLLETIRKVQRSEDTAVWKKNHHGLPRNFSS
jgi:CheY-like chemotaxis protein